MFSEEDFTQVVERIYEAAFDLNRYAAVANDVSQLIGADGVTFVLHATDTQKVHFAGMGQYDHLPVDEVLSEYGAEWHLKNPQVLFERRHPQAPVYYEGIDPRLSGSASADFRKWVRARVGARSQMTSFCRPDPHLTFAFAFSFHQKDRPDSSAEIDYLRQLTGHLQRSVRLAFQLGSLQGRRDQWDRHLMQHDLALAIFERDGRLALCNPAMERFIRGDDGLRLSATGLTATDPTVQRRLRELIARAVHPVQADEPAAMALHGRTGEFRGLLEVTGLPPIPDVLVATPGRFIITIKQPAGQSAAARRKLENLFGLTPAEGQVAYLLMRGLPAAEVAQQLALQVSTVRTHIRAILQKTHARNKTELAHWLTLCIQ